MTESNQASAMRIANEALNRVNTHEEVCGLRYEAIDNTLKDLKGLLKWGGSVAFAIIVGMLGWSLKTQFDAIQMKSANDAARIASLESQLSNRQDSPNVTVVR